jgi:hypothetical protein
MIHFITKEEIGQIIDLTERMDGIPGWVKEVRPIADKRMKIIKKILDRPDPLEILEKWIDDGITYYRTDPPISSLSVKKMLQEIRDDIDAVIKRGESEGWLMTDELRTKEQTL